MASSKLWVDRMHRFAYNPTSIMRTALDYLDDVYAGTADVGEVSNPFVQSMETAAFTAAAAMQECAVNTRKMYRSLAMTPDDLYLHMSDRDYIDRFATPARTTIYLCLAKQEIQAMAIQTPSPQVRKLVIPRHTRFTVNNTEFTMQYPIEIRVMAHGGLQIVYDNTSPSPLQTLTTNLVEWRVLNWRGIEYIELAIPVAQFKINSHLGSGNLTQNFIKSWSFTDQFYYARAFFKNGQGQWQEMVTTHTDQVFDPLKPTAQLKLLANSLQMTIPQIYATMGTVSGDYRLDIYTTKGPMSMSLNDFSSKDFVIRFEDLERSDNGMYSAPMSNFRTMFVLSDAEVTGGSNALTFMELRERTMNGVANQDAPITNVQLMDRLYRRGYDSVANIDNITNRQFLATRQLPAPEDHYLSSGAPCTIQTFITTMEEIGSLETASDNLDRVTLHPSTLFTIKNGIIEIVPKATADSILALPLDVRARRINEGHYLYTPFHYVLDRNNDSFDCRPYYLDNPKTVSKSFVEENATTGLQVSIQHYDLVRTPDGYQLTLVLSSSQEWKDLDDNDVFCQLSFIPKGQEDRAYLNGTLLGTIADERTYVFDINSNYDLDEDHCLGLTSFSMYSDGPRTHFCPLDVDMDVMFAVANYSIVGLMPSNIDVEMSEALLPPDAIGVSRERLSLQLGEAMTGLWSASRSVASSEDYQRYAADVPAVYEKTIFEVDPVTGAIKLEMDPDTSEITYVVLHAKGDPVLDEEGNPIIRYAAGEIMLDNEGKPVIVSSRGLSRHIDLMFVDGVYWFADQAQSVAYRESIPRTIAGWLREDIAWFSQYLIEQTRLYYYPKATLGQVKAIVRENQETLLAAGQSFAVNFYLSGTQFRDAELRVALSQMAINTIAEELRQPVVRMNNIVSRLTAQAGDDIISVEVSGLGGNANYPAVTLLDDSARLGIRLQAVAYADGTIGIAESVAMNFLQHVEK